MNNKNFLQKLFLINSELQETSNNSFNTNYLIISVAFFLQPFRWNDTSEGAHYFEINF